MKTIAFFTPQMTIGGAQSYVINKSQWLIDQGYQVIVVSAGGVWIKKLSNKIIHLTIEEIKIPPYYLSRKKRDKIINIIVKIIIDYKIDIIEAHNSYPILYALLAQKKNKVPVLLNVLSELAYVKNPLLCYITRILEKQGLYYTLNQEMNSFIEKKIHISLKNCKIIPIPIPQNNACISSTRGSYILTVCRMAPEKMYLKYLMEDFTKLIIEQKINPLYKLVIVGDGELYEEIKTKAIQLNTLMQRDAIILKGFCEGSELDLLYANCDLYVGSGTTLLTGVLYEKPSIIVGSTTDTMPYAWGFWGVDDTDTIGANQVKKSKDSYFNLIEQITTDDNLYEQISSISLKCSDKYSINSVMQKWENEYRNVIQSSKSNKKYLLINPIIQVLHQLGILISWFGLNRFLYKSFNKI